MKTLVATPLLALLVGTALIGGPALAQEILPGHTGSPPSPETKAAIANSIAASEKLDPLPAGTPTGDYEFMGWCTGILTGHMELYNKVKPQLDVISKRWNSVDEDNKQQAAQQTEGHALLARFRKVMAAAEATKPGLGATGQAAFQKGMASWAGVDKADKQQQAYSWMNFGFPAQCETRVTALEKTPISVADRSSAKPVATVAKPALKGKLKSKAESEPKATDAGLRP
jgi:hypothetical protein